MGLYVDMLDQTNINGHTITENKFEHIDASRISQKIAEQIKKLFFDGTLQSGDKLPSERELSKLLGVGRLSLREGLRILESMGILETKYGVGSGTYVAGMAIEKITEKMSDIMRLRRITLNELIEARREISLANLKYFHQRSDEEDIAKLEECIKEAEKLVKQGLHPRNKYIEFHRIIAMGSKNPVFVLIYNSLLDILLKEVLSKYVCPQSHTKKFLSYNKEILKHLKEKDLKEASSAMEKYLTFLKRSIELRMNVSVRPSYSDKRRPA